MKNQLIAYYLEYRNDFLSLERFAEYHGVTFDVAEAIINSGRDCWIDKNNFLDSMEALNAR